MSAGIQRRNHDDAPSKSVRTCFAASTFAGLSRLGVFEESREITLRSYAIELSDTREV